MSLPASKRTRTCGSKAGEEQKEWRARMEKQLETLTELAQAQDTDERVELLMRANRLRMRNWKR